MASIATSPITTEAKGRLPKLKKSDDADKIGKVGIQRLVTKPNLLEYCFSFLSGLEVATIASVSKAIGKRSQTQYLWEELYRNDFSSFEHSFRSHHSLSNNTRYKHAFDSFKLRHCQFYQVCHGRENGGAIERQGSNGAMITTIPKAVFCILGGWTTRGLSVALSVLYERPAPVLERANENVREEGTNKDHQVNVPAKSGYNWKTYSIRNRNRENATYGHSVTRIPPGALIESEALLTYGGVTMGGYRGEVSCLTAIIIDVESEESKSMNEPGIFWWKPLTLDNSENGAIARSYHTANFIDEDTGSKDGIHHIHVNKLYIFGGFDSNGAISSFQSVALEADTSGVEIIASGFEDVNADGEGPCRRFGHTCTYVKGRLFVAGGSTGSSNYKGHRDGEELQDSIYCLNMESHTLRWEKINFAINDSLSFAGLCRCHSAVNINDNILFSFGGAPNETTNHLHLLDLSDMEMHRVATVNESHLPRPRQNQSVAMLPCGTRMVVFGGALALPYGSEELGDTWILDLDAHASNREAIEECNTSDPQEDIRMRSAQIRRAAMIRALFAQAQQAGLNVEDTGSDNDSDGEYDFTMEDDGQGGNRCTQQ